MRMAGRFVRLLKAWAKANGVPVIYYRTAGERKHEIAERYPGGEYGQHGAFLALAAWREITR